MSAVAPVFLLMGVGGAARALKWINASGEQSLLKLVVNVVYPAFLFWLVVQNEAIRSPEVVFKAIFTGFVFILIGYALFYAAGPLFGLKNNRERRTFSFTGGIYNYGYFAIPISTSLFGLETTGVLMVISVGVEISMWSVGVLIVSGEINRRSIKRVLSPPVIAILAAIAINKAGFGPAVPTFAMDFLDILGRCAVPLGLIMIGSTIQQLIVEQPLFTRPMIAVGSCLLRSVAMPLIMLALIYLMPVPDVLKQAAMVHAAMPCGVFPIVLCRVYNGATDIALRTVIPTCILALVTIPIWIKIGLSWID
ncbi:MAG: AEC family transporter [Verrucomicrobiota bacterium]